MAAVRYSARALADLERVVDFLAVADPRAALGAADTIADAIRVLQRHPHIGRPVRGAVRELVIAYGRSGYVALYRVSARRDLVDILAIRHQREAGYQ